MSLFSKACLGATVVALVVTSTAASARSPHLTGDYAYTGEGSCLYSPQGFDPMTLTPLGFSFTSSFSVTGTWSWDGNGQSSLTGRIVSFSYSPSVSGTTFAPSASGANISARFTNGEANADGTFQVNLTAFLGKFTSGSRTGQQFTSDSARVLAYVSQNGKTLTMATTEPAVDTQTIYDIHGKPVQKVPRICHATRTLTKVAS